MSRKASDTYAWMMSNIERMSSADMEAFGARHPAFRASLADNVIREKNAWLAGGMSAAEADRAAINLWGRGMRAAKLEVAAREQTRFSPSDIGWVTRRRNQEKAAKAARRTA